MKAPLKVCLQQQNAKPKGANFVERQRAFYTLKHEPLRGNPVKLGAVASSATLLLWYSAKCRKRPEGNTCVTDPCAAA